MRAPLPDKESQRLESLYHHKILDTLPEPNFDELTQLASQICDVPIALVSLIDAHRQWFKSRVGLDATETHRDYAFCAHAILEPHKVLLVPDATNDERFADNPLVTSDPNIRFYLGVPLVNSQGHPLGTLCVIDRVPRKLTDNQIYAIKVLGRQVISQIELRQKMHQMADLIDQVESTKTDLQRSNQDLTHFASVASHDLMAPLWIIKMYSQLLSSDCDDQLSSQGQNHLKRITTAAERMRCLLDGLMKYSTITIADRTAQQTDLAILVRQVVSDLDVTIQEADGRVDINQLPTIYADTTQIHQLFQNLILNAMKFRREDIQPLVRIDSQIVTNLDDIDEPDGLAGTGPWCRIVVQDNGIGFEAKHSDQIFGAFKRLHTHDEYKGTGVGLSICKRVVERHHGTIKAHSEQGQGATFIITLPVHQNAKQQPSPDRRQDLPAA